MESRTNASKTRHRQNQNDLEKTYEEREKREVSLAERCHEGAWRNNKTTPNTNEKEKKEVVICSKTSNKIVMKDENHTEA